MKYVKTIVVAGMLLFLAGSSSAMSRRVSQQKTNEEGFQDYFSQDDHIDFCLHL